MNAQEMAIDIPGRSAMALGLLVQVIDDPRAKSRERLQAARMLKTCLLWLNRLVEAQQTSPDVRKDIIEVLRSYRRSSSLQKR
jgi:hypothetical protein